MKYCPYCGASLVDGAAPFCSECGQTLPSSRIKPQIPVPKPQAPGSSPKNRGSNKPPGKLHKPVKKSSNWLMPRPRLKRPAKQPIKPIRKPKTDPRDEGYDGYYNDVLPDDGGHIRDPLDPEMIKRAVLVAAGAFVIIVLTVLLMAMN